MSSVLGPGRVITEVIGPDGNPVTSGNPLPVSTADPRDLRGTAANRPAAGSVSAGVTYWAVDTGVVSVSTGSTWVTV